MTKQSVEIRMIRRTGGVVSQMRQKIDVEPEIMRAIKRVKGVYIFDGKKYPSVVKYFNNVVESEFPGWNWTSLVIA